MKKQFFLILFCTAIVTIMACKKEQVDTPQPDKHTGVCMKYAMTQCADPWMVCCGTPPQPTDSVLIGAYFARTHINAAVQRVVQENQGMVCAACNCSSGKIVYVSVADTSVARLTALGFVPCTQQTATSNLHGTWHYKYATGGFAGGTYDLTPENKTLVLDATTAKIYANGALENGYDYVLAPRNPSFGGDSAMLFSFNGDVVYQHNYTLRNDSLWLIHAAADGFSTLLTR